MEGNHKNTKRERGRERERERKRKGDKACEYSQKLRGKENEDEGRERP